MKKSIIKRLYLLLTSLTCAAMLYAEPGGQTHAESVPGQNPPHPSRMPEDGIPAFPGAWGAGMFTTGGRGGKAYLVTNLNDSGPGSLREAIEAEGPRIVIFRVAGTIELQSDLDIVNPDITIAGQTAPGDGICLAKGTLHINTHNVIVRHIRARKGTLDGSDDSIGGHPEHHVIVDHCSCSWSRDENISIYRHMRPSADGTTQIKDPSRYVTIQWTISSECFYQCGATWGGMPSTFHHNLFACNQTRNPSIGMSGDFDYRFNVAYNWKNRTCDGGDETSQVNFINNYYKPGPATEDNMKTVLVRLEERRMYSPGKAWADGGWYDESHNPRVRPGKWYIAGNVMEGCDSVTLDNWKGVLGNREAAKVNTPFVGWPVAPYQTAEQAYASVLDGCGATLPRRDAVDRRIVESVRNGNSSTTPTGIVASVEEAGGYPVLSYSNKEVPRDSDKDGMPDEWEKANGFDAKNAADALGDKDGDGYSNLEEYINGTNPSEYVDYHNLGNNIDRISFN